MAECRSCGCEVMWTRVESRSGASTARVAVLLDESPIGDLLPNGVTAKGELVLRRVPAGDGRYVAHMPKDCEATQPEEGDDG